MEFFSSLQSHSPFKRKASLYSIKEKGTVQSTEKFPIHEVHT